MAKLLLSAELFDHIGHLVGFCGSMPWLRVVRQVSRAFGMVPQLHHFDVEECCSNPRTENRVAKPPGLSKPSQGKRTSKHLTYALYGAPDIF